MRQRVQPCGILTRMVFPSAGPRRHRPLPDCQDYWASPVLVGDLVVSGGESEHMLVVLALPVFYAGRVVACGVDAVLYLLNAETGVCEAQTPFDAPITAAPVVLDDGLCVATWDGRLRRFSVE
jgi:hypothetical protein